MMDISASHIGDMSAVPGTSDDATAENEKYTSRDRATPSSGNQELDLRAREAIRIAPCDLVAEIYCDRIRSEDIAWLDEAQILD